MIYCLLLNATLVNKQTIALYSVIASGRCRDHDLLLTAECNPGEQTNNPPTQCNFLRQVCSPLAPPWSPVADSTEWSPGGQRGHDLLQLLLPDAALVDREATIYCSYYYQMQPWWTERPWSTAAITARCSPKRPWSTAAITARCSPGGQRGHDLLQLTLPDAALVDREATIYCS